MVEALIMQRFRLMLLLAGLALPAAGLAHQLDEYLQATLVVIDPAAIQLQIILTPGVSVAEQVLGLMDRDADGSITTKEATDYAELLRHDFSVQLDGRDLELKLTASDVPTPAELRTGAGIMQVEFSAVPGEFAAGPHTLALQNRHFASLGVYLLNAAKPRMAEIQIIRQKRNEKQSEGEIEFTFQRHEKPFPVSGLLVAITGGIVAVFAMGWRMLRKKRMEDAG